MKNLMLILGVTAAVFGTGGAALAEGDAALGKNVFKKCMACHDAVTEKNKVGPHLVGIIGRKAGAAADYKYSKAYLTETPVWKTTYRLVLDEDKAPYLQGWAIVENQTQQDWRNVKLSLVSGRPISFTMDLYQPLYNPRPVVQPELYANLKPQTYGDAMDELKPMASAPPARSDMKKERLLGKMAQGFAGGRANAPAAKAVAAEMEMGSLEEGVAPMAMAEDKGELFEYRIDQPVTLAKHTSALLPIIGQTLQGQKVSLYNQSVNAKHPLNGYRLKNTSALHLMQGPITLFDSGTYAGDARIEDLPPGQDRLISYALDLKTEVEPKLEGGTQELATVSLKKGTMLISRRLVEDRTYLVKNRDAKAKTVLDRTTLSCRLETCRTERADRADARPVPL